MGCNTQISIRLPEQEKNDIDEIVDAGAAINATEFIRHAIDEKIIRFKAAHVDDKEQPAVAVANPSPEEI